MAVITCDFTIENENGIVRSGIYSNRIVLKTSREIVEIAEVAGLDCLRYGDVLLVKANMDVSNPKYSKLLEKLKREQGLSPAVSKIIPWDQKDYIFDPKLSSTWTEKEISSAPLLRLLVNAPIAKQSDGTTQQVDAEILSYCDVSKTTQIGVVMPFHGIGVAGELGKLLEKESLSGLRFTPGVDNSGKSKRIISALRSDVIMPPALNPLINEAGEVVPPNTQWWCFHDDGGRSPEVLRYRAAEVKALGDFDIAMTYERVGFRKAAAYRWCIISQRFREVLKKLKVRSVTCVPVELEC